MSETQTYKYEEVFVTGEIHPIIVLQNLLQEGVISDYILYQDRDEVRIAGNMLFKVSVRSEVVSLEDTEKKLSVPISDPFKQVESLLASLPITGWTAYGYIAFDIVRFYSSYSKAIQQPLLCFIVPEIELHITRQRVKIKSIKSLDKIKKLLSMNNQLTEFVPTPISINVIDNERESYQSKVDVLIQAIQAGKLQKAILSRSVKIKGDLDILKTYIAGTKVNNSARSYCLNIGDVRAVGFSPEILMQMFLIYDAIQACCADGEYSEKERAVVLKGAKKLGISDEVFKQIEEIYLETVQLREKRLAVMYPNGKPF